MIRKILFRGVFVVVILAAGSAVYLATTSVDVVVTAHGCGAVQPPVALPLAWRATADGGVARVPALTVHVAATVHGGQETLTVTAPAGISAPFAVGDNVTRVVFDGMPLFQRPLLTGAAATFDLGRIKRHHLVLECR